MNQCDGCAQGLPLKGNMHMKDGRSWIVCTAEKYAAPAPDADGLIARLCNPSLSCSKGPRGDIHHEAAAALAAQAREIAELREQLSKANIDAANLMAECSDMSVDIEKYRSEITEARAARDEAQRAGVTTANYWMERAEAERDALRECIEWALGEGEDFPAWPDTVTITGNPKYWWRTELLRRYDAARAKVKP